MNDDKLFLCLLVGVGIYSFYWVAKVIILLVKLPKDVAYQLAPENFMELLRKNRC